jgi:serine/threonine-protein kinase
MRRIGSYEIRELLGEGGIGQVHAAFDTVLQREVAIKSLRPEKLRDATFADRFRSEATSLARLNHPNIATLHTMLVEGRSLYMVMELVRGRTLETVMQRRGGPLGAEQSLAIIAQAADGLAYAHSMGVIHRDIKPANLMLSTNGHLKIMDFGIARVQGSQRLTRDGSMVGTLAYMAPEQIRGEPGDERSDIYSLAIVLYELLSGSVPFTASTEYDLMQAQIHARPGRLASIVPGLDSRIDAAIMKALAKNPEQRFRSINAFKAAIGLPVAKAAPIAISEELAATTNRRALATLLRSVTSAFDALPLPAERMRRPIIAGAAAALMATLLWFGASALLPSSPPLAPAAAGDLSPHKPDGKSSRQPAPDGGNRMFLQPPNSTRPATPIFRDR